MSNIYYDIPSYKSNRKKLTNQLYDLNHRDYCHTEGFHAKIDPTFFCKIWGHQMEHYHDRYCEENINRCKAATVVLERIKIDSNKPDSFGQNNKGTRKKNEKVFLRVMDKWIILLKERNE